MTHGMMIEYLKCRADPYFEFDFEVSGAIRTIVIMWDFIHSDNGSFSSIILVNILFLNTHHMPLINYMEIICKKSKANLLCVLKIDFIT